MDAYKSRVDMALICFQHSKRVERYHKVSMEQISVLYRLVLTVTCLVCLGFSGGMCSEFDPLIKTYVSSSLPSKSNDGLVYSRKLKGTYIT
ncbi:hypothetical protein AtNW77_Chr1g0052691 [Arabidopsis thaliana]